MKNTSSLTLKIINDKDILESFNHHNSLSESQKELIRFIVPETVQEGLRKIKELKENHHKGISQDRILWLAEVSKMLKTQRYSKMDAM